jgi:hypothetical protein
MADPEFVITDWAKFERPAQMHIGFQFIDAFQAKNGRLPMPYSEVCVRWHGIMLCFAARASVILFEAAAVPLACHTCPLLSFATVAVRFF